MDRIVPKKKAQGVDICGDSKLVYIVRSDLGCYMKCPDFIHGKDLSVHSLSLPCKGGDHYLADKDHFYVIKKNEFLPVTNMTTDTLRKAVPLHPNCQGGDHYLSHSGYFFIIFLDKGIYRRTTNLNSDADGHEYPLDPGCKAGLYFWATGNLIHFLRDDSKWGVQVDFVNELNEFIPGLEISVHPDVINFLPGGLAVTQGSAFGKWENIKSIDNPSSSVLNWEKKITKKVGFTREKMSSIEHNWKISMTATYQSGDLTAAFAKYQFSLGAEYGGVKVDTDKEQWSEATDVEETMKIEIKPGQSIYIWQYNLGLGKESVLFCRDLLIDDVPTPPTKIPLPAAPQ
ncbi:uncharacterized protein [Lepisosteus oculatus]|nr:PREDICTED: uncharacterized protein LOC107079466 isoform X2 [Lepisosteus oculatus]XP_015219433.1 PREDICTED: uncharacterized protein LOC107079466 isoform X2 [Lepisosteus oculatus]XP_015219434.1 PREDICTED: uncharacterized protein LOC107079466 isoform X2 [Lepisosteus oculatus]XP_015219435.1 PREDICTED: uncharacterized protein LOC107079466 isoform X2 [Lepisosteus oculatus]XP_015219436.1 PREDICTED: uncharacterized protein LOC107079466 isoform X2 [Lepisosteus oculatus]